MVNKSSNRPLFPDNLPILPTDEELLELQKNFPKLDPCYLASAVDENRRDFLEKLWQKFRDNRLNDSNFIRTIQEKGRFKQRFWEMYLGNVLIDKGLEVHSKNAGPDLVVNEKLYIECVAPTTGYKNKEENKDNSVPEVVYGECSKLPEDQQLLRITRGIKNKSDQYNEWLSNRKIDSKIPYIIAIYVDFGYPDFGRTPLVIKVLFDRPARFVEKKPHYLVTSSIQKRDGSTVELGYFKYDRYRSIYCHISAVLFSHRSVTNYGSQLGADCILAINPFATNPVDAEMANLFNSWTGTH